MSNGEIGFMNDIQPWWIFCEGHEKLKSIDYKRGKKMERCLP
jgi:hypothetical protein